MNIAQMARDEAAFKSWRRDAFPFFRDKIFLTHASVSPLPRSVAQAVSDYAFRIMREGQFDPAQQAQYERCKERVAGLIGHGARSDEVAFAGSTSHALGIVATAIDWRAGDNCVVADGDFPANVVTWKALQRRHQIDVRMIPFRPQMNFSLDDLKPLVDDRTRIVSLCSANFLSGCPIDLASIGAWLRERAVLFCVDAIQTLGAVSLDASHVDFVCADAHKWLLGPNGIAILWARRPALKQLNPAVFGWLSPQNRENWFSYDTTPIDSAERFEPGARNYLGILALDAALALHEEVGAQWIEERVAGLRDYVAQRLEDCGCSLLWKPESGRKAGIVSFQARDGKTELLFNHLSSDFELSLREDKMGQKWIRVSPHWMNLESDLDELAHSIKSAQLGIV